MNWLPTIPTDNLYKYMALSGLWLLFGICALMTFLVYQAHENERFSKKQLAIYSDESLIREYTKRIKSISTGKTSENIIPNISDIYKPKDEIAFLKTSVKANQDEIKRYSVEIEKRPPNFFRFFEPFNFISVTFTFVSLYLAGCLLAFFGFKNWRKLQLVADEIQNCDLELKRLHLAHEKRPRIKRKC